MAAQGEEERQAILADMRRLYAGGDYAGALSAFEGLQDLNTIRSNIRIEAMALAARSLIGQGDTTGARAVIKPVWKQQMKNHRQYRYLAQVCLELGEYAHAATLSQAAADLKAEAVAASKGSASNESVEGGVDA